MDITLDTLFPQGIDSIFCSTNGLCAEYSLPFFFSVWLVVENRMGPIRSLPFPVDVPAFTVPLSFLAVHHSSLRLVSPASFLGRHAPFYLPPSSRIDSRGRPPFFPPSWMSPAKVLFCVLPPGGFPKEKEKSNWAVIFHAKLSPFFTVIN